MTKDSAALPPEGTVDTIRTALRSNDDEVRREFFREFSADADEFATVMAEAFEAWRPIDALARGPDRAFVAALAHAAITLHIESMKLFLAGHIVAAGNLFRQTVETVAMSLLACIHALPYREHFIANQYSTSKAVTDLLKKKNSRRLASTNIDALQALRESQDFYHLYSHPTQLTLAAQISFAGEGLYVGSNFDAGKLEQYRKEIAGRLSLARVLPGIMQVLMANLERWPALPTG